MAREPFPGERPKDWTPPDGSTPKAKAGFAKNAAIGCATIVGVLIVLGVIGAALGPSPDERKAEAGAEAAKAAASAMTVDAGDLWRDYQANEVSAQARYGDKPLLVTGTIESIALDFANDPYITFVSDNQFMATQADLADEDKDKVGALAKGQRATVLCTGVTEIAGRPMLRDCLLR